MVDIYEYHDSYPSDFIGYFSLRMQLIVLNKNCFANPDSLNSKPRGYCALSTCILTRLGCSELDFRARIQNLNFIVTESQIVRNMNMNSQEYLGLLISMKMRLGPTIS